MLSEYKLIFLELQSTREGININVKEARMLNGNVLETISDVLNGSLFFGKYTYSLAFQDLDEKNNRISSVFTWLSK